MNLGTDRHHFFCSFSGDYNRITVSQFTDLTAVEKRDQLCSFCSLLGEPFSALFLSPLSAIAAPLLSLFSLSSSVRRQTLKREGVERERTCISHIHNISISRIGFPIKLIKLCATISVTFTTRRRKGSHWKDFRSKTSFLENKKDSSCGASLPPKAGGNRLPIIWIFDKEKSIDFVANLGAWRRKYALHHVCGGPFWAEGAPLPERTVSRSRTIKRRKWRERAIIFSAQGLSALTALHSW